MLGTACSQGIDLLSKRKAVSDFNTTGSVSKSRGATGGRAHTCTMQHPHCCSHTDSRGLILEHGHQSHFSDDLHAGPGYGHAQIPCPSFSTELKGKGSHKWCQRFARHQFQRSGLNRSLLHHISHCTGQFIFAIT